MSGTVESGQGFSWADYLSSLNLPPTAGLGPTMGALPPEWEASWISKSEQEKARDIFALMPSMPMMSFETFKVISQNFPQIFSIANVGAAGGGWKAFGPTETGLTLAAAFVWAQQQNQESDLVRLLRASPEKNPLELALAQFVENATLIPVDALGLQLVMRQMPILSAVMQTIDPKVREQALAIAMSQVVLSLLDKWIESEAAISKEQREAAKRADIQLQQAAFQLLRNYFSKVTAKEEALSQPLLSMIMGSLLMSGMAIGSIGLISPFLLAITGTGATIPLLAGVPPTVQALMGALSVGIVSAATTWATPVAMALVASAGGGISSQQAAYDSAKAFAVTIASFIMSPSLDSFVSGQLQEATSAGLIDDAQAKRIAAAFKVSLLMCAMAALYKAETGGITGEELRGLIKGTVPLSDEELHRTLSMLVEDSMKLLSPDEAEKLLAQLIENYDQELELGTVTEPITSFLEVWSQNLGPEAATATPA